MSYHAQGARCGHIDGKKRAGSYVQGEEIDLAVEAASFQGLDIADRAAFASGYRKGYVLGAEGSPLPPEYI